MLQIYSLVDESKRKIGYRLKTDIGVFDMPIQLEPVGGFNNIAGQIEVRKDSFGDYASAEEYGLSKDKKIPNLGANEYLKNLVTQHIGGSGAKLGFRVFLGDRLVKETSRYSGLGTRDCFEDLSTWLRDADATPNTMILFGMRRTGKTVLLYQSMQMLLDEGVQANEVAYFTLRRDKIDTEELLAYIQTLIYDLGVKYIFIDEVTFLADDMSGLSALYDEFGGSGAKFVLSGTNTAGFLPVLDEYLYDRALCLSTSYISFNEFNRLLPQGENDVKSYIALGGVFKETARYVSRLSSSSRRKETPEGYVRTAITRNICGSLEHSRLLRKAYPEISTLVFSPRVSEMDTLFYKWLEAYSKPLTSDILQSALSVESLSKAARNLRTHGSLTLYKYRKDLADKIIKRLDLREHTVYSESLLSELKELLSQLECLKEVSEGMSFLVPLQLKVALLDKIVQFGNEEYNALQKEHPDLVGWEVAEKSIRSTASGVLFEDVIYLSMITYPVRFRKYRNKKGEEIDVVFDNGNLCEIKVTSKPSLADCRWLTKKSIWEDLGFSDNGVSLYLISSCKENRILRGTREDVLNAVIAKRQAVNPNWKPQPDLLAELESSKNDNFIYNIQCISAEEFLLNLSKYAGDGVDATNYFD